MAWLGLLAVPAALSVLAIATDRVPLKLSEAVASALVVVVAVRGLLGAHRSALAVVAALAASAVGDYFLSTKGGKPGRFIAGIGAFLLAHLCYLAFCLANGRMSLAAVLALLAVFLPYYLFVLRRAIGTAALSLASLAYLVVSCLTLAAAVGLNLGAVPSALFAGGIGLIVVSDVAISLKEFLRWKNAGWLILPTYYLAHLGIVAALLVWVA